MRARDVLTALAITGLCTGSASAQFAINSGNVSGVTDGHATPVGGGPIVDDDRVDTPFTTNASNTHGSGGTSGGLGDAAAIGGSEVVLTVDAAPARGFGAFSLDIHAVGSAYFDTVNYTGSIGSSLQATLFIEIDAPGPQPYSLYFTGDWSSRSTSGVIQASGGGAMIDDGMIWPGSYVVTVPNAHVHAGTESLPPIPSFDGHLFIIIPAPGAGVALAGAGMLAATRRRRIK